MSSEGKEVFASYNGMARKALTFGVPTLTLIGLLFSILISLFVGVWLFGITVGLIIPTLLVGILFFIKIKCEDDSRAMDEWAWEMKGLILRIMSQSTVLSFGSFGDTFEMRKKNVKRFYQDNTD